MVQLLRNDDDIIVCIKPSGVLSEGEGADSMITLLKEQTGSSVLPVHRLDRETAGVMVYAKNSRSAAFLSEQIRNNGLKKKYLAVIRGSMDEKSGNLDDLLFRDKQKNKTYVVKRLRKGVREASLEYKILGEAADYSLAEILLHTGRTHQIRVQFSSRKHPLYGDGRYGGGSGELALFACSLSFVHPSDRQKTEFTAKPDASAYPWSLFGDKI